VCPVSGNKKAVSKKKEWFQPDFVFISARIVQLFAYLSGFEGSMQT
jgi:hypothetical protein